MLAWLTLRNAKLLALAALVAWGAWGEVRVSGYEARLAAEALAAATERERAAGIARETERLAARATQRISDELLIAKRARDAAARTAAQRLRELARARAAGDAAAASCQSYGGAPVDVIPGATREALVELARDADEVADQLRACQAYITDVVKQ